jgi:hypothetical protein
MFALLRLLVSLISNWLKSRRRLEVENLYLRRHQLNIALRRAPHSGKIERPVRWLTRGEYSELRNLRQTVNGFSAMITGSRTKFFGL